MNAASRTLTVGELRTYMSGMGPNTPVRVAEHDTNDADVLGVTTGPGGVVQLEVSRDVDLQAVLDVLQEIADSGRSATARKAQAFLETI